MTSLGERGILVLDVGTTSTRAAIFFPDGHRTHMEQLPLNQHFPRPGWVEQDAAEIFSKTIICARRAIAAIGSSDCISAIGIANQRETVVAWDRHSGKAVCPAIVWQDRRTAEFCEELKRRGAEDEIRQKTGLLADPYFSASKMRWILRNTPEAAALGERLALGTVESWIVWKLTGGLHVSDVTNACRTMLFPLEGTQWDAGLVDLFELPETALPEVTRNCDYFGASNADWFGAPIPIAGMIGDQQSATIGQGCLGPGNAKATLGTGAFVLSSTGVVRPRSAHRLLETVLCWTENSRSYALEGSIFAAGSVIKWLRDGLGVLDDAQLSETLARQVDDNGGVVFVPALAGLGAPFWRPDATASLTGLTFSSSRAHVIRAALESVANQCLELKEAFALDGGDWSNLKIDGGMSENDWIAQDLADILDVRIERPVDVETTARGAAIVAALGIGLFANLQDAAASMTGKCDVFSPQMNASIKAVRKTQWNDAIHSMLGGV